MEATAFCPAHITGFFKAHLDDNQNNLENLVVQLITENNEIKNTLLRENQELRQQIGELIPKIGNNNTVNNTVNNKFNINVFLNEKCKDAITMTDFVHQIEISLKNLPTATFAFSFAPTFPLGPMEARSLIKLIIPLCKYPSTFIVSATSAYKL